MRNLFKELRKGGLLKLSPPKATLGGGSRIIDACQCSRSCLVDCISCFWDRGNGMSGASEWRCGGKVWGGGQGREAPSKGCRGGCPPPPPRKGHILVAEVSGYTRIPYTGSWIVLRPGTLAPRASYGTMKQKLWRSKRKYCIERETRAIYVYLYTIFM